MLEKYSPKEIKNINEAINSIYPSISYIKKELGEAKIKAILVLLIADAIQFFSVGKTMGETQIVQTVNLILEDYYYFKIEDFQLCFKNAKSGKYGKLYDRLDGAIIFEWLAEYDFERLAEIERIRIEQHNESKKEVSGSQWSEESKKKLNEIYENIIEKSEIKSERIENNKNESIDIVQGWMKLFDRIHRKKQDSPGLRFIEIRGQKMDGNQFLLYKMDQYKKVKEYLSKRAKR